MNVPPHKILPSQNFLKEETVAYIFDCIKNNTPNALPPEPIVRKDTSGNLIAIDGHNLIAVRLYLKQNINVHIAESLKDGLAVSTSASMERNRDLKEKYDTVLDKRNEVVEQGIDTFYDLLSRYPHLFPTSA